MEATKLDALTGNLQYKAAQGQKKQLPERITLVFSMLSVALFRVVDLFPANRPAPKPRIALPSVVYAPH